MKIRLFRGNCSVTGTKRWKEHRRSSDEGQMLERKILDNSDAFDLDELEMNTIHEIGNGIYAWVTNDDTMPSDEELFKRFTRDDDVF